MKPALVILFLFISYYSFSQDPTLRDTVYADKKIYDRNLVYVGLAKQSVFSAHYERICNVGYYFSVHPHAAVGHIPGSGEDTIPSNDMLFLGSYFLVGIKYLYLEAGADLVPCWYGSTKYLNLNGNFGIRYQNKGDLMISLTYNPILLSSINGKAIVNLPFGLGMGLMF